MRHRTLTACLLLLGLAGCAYRVGYTQLRVEVAPVEGGYALPAAADPLLAVVGFPTPEAPTIRATLLDRRAVERPVIRTFTGLPVRAEYHWINALIKPIVPLTAVLGVVMPRRNRNDRDADGWDTGDALRDFIAWVNPFEALPVNQQRSATHRQTIRRERGHGVFVQERTPGAARTIWLHAGGERLQAALTGDDGEVEFDLRQIASKLPDSGETVVTLSAGTARRRVVLPAEVIASVK